MPNGPAGPVTVHGAVADMQVETNTSNHLLTVQARGSQKISPAGQIATIGALNTYYSSTLSTAQKAALPDFLCHVTATTLTAYAAPGTEAALATALIAAVGTNTVRA